MEAVEISRHDDSGLMRDRDVAGVLACTTKTVWNLAKRGRLSAIRVPDVGTRFLCSEVRQFVESARTTSAGRREPAHA